MPTPLRGVLLLATLWLAAGCGGHEGPPPLTGDPMDASRQAALSELGEILRLSKQEGSASPKKVADLAKYGELAQVGFPRLKAGEVLLFWGSPIEDGNTATVLAYGTEVPDSGGYVLMQDGMTVKKLSAAEFQAAPKAGKDAQLPAKKK